MAWTRNGILSALSDEDQSLMKPHLEAVYLKRDDVLFKAYQKIPYVYFFESGLSSEVIVAGSSKIAVGCIGFEGFSGVPVVLGIDSSPHDAFMQGSGAALRIGASDLRHLMDNSKSITSLLLRYAHVLMVQIAATALVGGRYDLEARLARWLLMYQDRLGSEMSLTHDFLSAMLGVRRASITEALHKLEGKRVIRAERSLITIVSRSGLEALAKGCYGAPEAEYRRVILAEDSS